ncbi:MAG: lysophospholipid acyltransferase family protein [Pseudomonadota bacterium]
MDVCNLARLPGEAARTALLGVYRLSGWKVEGELPEGKKFVVIAAPHTSNWDLPFMLGVALHFRTRLHWMGKDTLFKPPFGWLMRALGGIPIDRSKANDVVSQMVTVFNDADRLAVAIPPEGTRSKTRYWKTGFYNIAHGAGVPIAFGFLDYARKVGGIGMTMKTTGDYDADLEIVKAFYATVSPKFPDRVGEEEKTDVKSSETERRP